MRTRLQQFLAVAGLTAIETLRQPICLLLATVGLVAVALLPLVLSHTLGEAPQMVADSALAFHFVAGLLLGGFAASRALTAEIRRGTAAAVLATPVSRETFFLAKYAGLALVVILFSATLTLASLMSVRTVASGYERDAWGAGPLLVAAALAYAAGGAINFALRRPFVSDAFLLLMTGVVLAFAASGAVDRQGHLAPFGSSFIWPLVPIHALVTMAVLVLTAIALALATRLDVVPTVSICSALFFAGLVSDYLFGRRAATDRVAAAVYAILPNWQHFWLADAIRLQSHVPARYLLLAAAYTALYVAAILAAGLVSFRHTEVRA